MTTARVLAFILVMEYPVLLIAQTEQSKGKFRFISLKFHSGRHFYTGTELKDALKNGYNSFEVRVGWQSQGKQAWQREHLYPSYGIGFTAAM
ncbi:hypothetical protein [Paraflavitalea speifideaquila]|uniref:hypothetical protein n=1 Tax=Paraflavitalea speifideaquila TaxID=3076558 RepID=UPI0028EC11CB|nr:hypothetical protein [Paraflavitalea speifideiaquila]